MTQTEIYTRAARRFRPQALVRLKAAVICWLLRRRHTGSGSHIDSSVHVLGWRWVRIGASSIVSADCWLNVNNRTSSAGHLFIGNHCHVGRRNVLSSGRLLRLGDYCLTGPDCHFLGSDHLIDNPFVPYVATGATQDAVIDVGVNCWLGAGSAILGNVKIGHGSVIGARTLLVRDVPPFSVVVGNPGRVIKRFRMQTRSWIPAEEFAPHDDAALPDEDSYLAILNQRPGGLDMPLAAASKSMGDSP